MEEGERGLAGEKGTSQAPGQKRAITYGAGVGATGAV